MLGYGSRMTPVNGSVLRAPHAIPGGSAAKTRWGFVKREYRWKRKWVEASQEKEEDIARSAGAPTAGHSTRVPIAKEG